MRLHNQPGTDWKNVFQLWRENGETLPFKVAKSSWSAEQGHVLIVERVEVRNWPYGNAWGRYCWNGVPGNKGEKISQAGTYTWCRV